MTNGPDVTVGLSVSIGPNMAIRRNYTIIGYNCNTGAPIELRGIILSDGAM